MSNPIRAPWRRTTRLEGESLCSSLARIIETEDLEIVECKVVAKTAYIAVYSKSKDRTDCRIIELNYFRSKGEEFPITLLYREETEDDFPPRRMCPKSILKKLDVPLTKNAAAWRASCGHK